MHDLPIYTSKRSIKSLWHAKACRGLFEAMIVFISQTNKKARTVCLCLRFITREREGQTCLTASVAST
jgi:hypothetical protein